MLSAKWLLPDDEAPVPAFLQGVPMLDVRLFFLPLGLDVTLHLAPFLFLLFDVIRDPRPPQPAPGATVVQSGKMDAHAVMLLGVLYAAWLELCAQGGAKPEAFPYPFLMLAPPPARLGIYAIGALTASRVVRALTRVEQLVARK